MDIQPNLESADGNHLLLADESSLPSSQSECIENEEMSQSALFESVSLDSEASNQIFEDEGSRLNRSGKRKRDSKPSKQQKAITVDSKSNIRRTSPRFGTSLSAALNQERNKENIANGSSSTNNIASFSSTTTCITSTTSYFSNNNTSIPTPLGPVKREVASIGEVNHPESCSLFSSIPVSWKLQLPTGYSTNNSCWVKTLCPIHRPVPIRNGLWLKLNTNNNNNNNNHNHGNDLYLLIELHEKLIKNTEGTVENSPPSNPTPKSLVEFCSAGKCGSKRKEVIDMQDERVMARTHDGVFETLISINEQCSHRSSNPYGSPDTRFYLSLQLYEKTPNIPPQQQQQQQSSMRRLASHSSSSFIKVVAPGKNKASKDHPISTPSASTSTSNPAVSSTNLAPNPNTNLVSAADNNNNNINYVQMNDNVAPFGYQGQMNPKKMLKVPKGKLSVKQTLDAFVKTISGLNDRIVKLEKQSECQSKFIQMLLEERQVQQQQQQQQQYHQLQFLSQQQHPFPNNDNMDNNLDPNHHHHHHSIIASATSTSISTSTAPGLLPIKEEPNSTDSNSNNNTSFSHHHHQQHSNPLSPLLKFEFDGQEVVGDVDIHSLIRNLTQASPLSDREDTNAFFASSQERE